MVEEPGFAVAEILTGDETVDPFAGEQMWMVRAADGAEHAEVVLLKPSFMTKPSVGLCSVFCLAVLVTGKFVDPVSPATMALGVEVKESPNAVSFCKPPM